MRRILKGVLITLALVVILFVSIRVALDIFVETIVSQQLALRLESEVSVRSIDLSLLRGKVTVKDLVVIKALKDDQESSVSVGRLFADVRLLSLFSDTIDVQNVELADAYINIFALSKEIEKIDKGLSSNTNMPTGVDEKVVTTEETVGEKKPKKELKSILIQRVNVENFNLTYSDENLCKPPLLVDLRDVNVSVRNLLLFGQPDSELHSKIDLTCEIAQKNNSGYLGIWAKTGIIGLDGKIPAVNAILAINGLDLKDYSQIIPNGVITSLGGAILDVRVDAGVEQNFLLVKTKLTTVSGSFEVTVDGTPDQPNMDMTDILTALGMRGVMSVFNPIANVGDAGWKAGGAAMDTGFAAISGVSGAVGNIGKGLFNTVRSTSKGNFKNAGSSLLKTGTGTFGDVFNTATNMAGTATTGAIGSGGALMNKNSMEKWQTEVTKRKDAVWVKAPKDLEKMSYPKK